MKIPEISFLLRSVFLITVAAVVAADDELSVDVVNCEEKCGTSSKSSFIPLPADVVMKDVVAAWIYDPVINASAVSDLYGTDIGCWDVSLVTDMTSTFNRQKEFNDYLGCWDTSSVTSMGSMFFMTTNYNQPGLNLWNTSNVEMISDMFYQSSFNQKLNDWDVSKITTASGVFEDNVAFNQYVGDWNVKNIQEIYHMFNGATQFKQNLDKWGLLINSDSVDTKNIFRGTSCEETVWDYKSSGIVCCGSCPIPGSGSGGGGGEEEGEEEDKEGKDNKDDTANNIGGNSNNAESESSSGSSSSFLLSSSRHLSIPYVIMLFTIVATVVLFR